MFVGMVRIILSEVGQCLKALAHYARQWPHSADAGLQSNIYVLPVSWFGWALVGMMSSQRGYVSGVQDLWNEAASICPFFVCISSICPMVDSCHWLHLLPLDRLRRKALAVVALCGKLHYYIAVGWEEILLLLFCMFTRCNGGFFFACLNCRRE